MLPSCCHIIDLFLCHGEGMLPVGKIVAMMMCEACSQQRNPTNWVRALGGRFPLCRAQLIPLPGLTPETWVLFIGV